jgi:hypothetical protein
MGFFSWQTQDTETSITNQFSDRPIFTVYMHDHLGNTLKEDNYEGYGVFGGKDFYELLAEMNGLKTREEGIELAFAKPARPCLHPNLTSCEKWEYVNRAPDNCPAQGYFYDNPEDDDYDNNW